MASGNNNLIIAGKNDVTKSSTNFRDVENWANGGKWNLIPLASGWSSYGGVFQIPQFFLDPFGFVCLRGLLNGPSVNSGTTYIIGTLPVTSRPPLQEIFWQASGSNVGSRIDILANGGIQLTATFTGSLVYLSLSGIRFATFK